MALQARTCVRN